MNSIFLLSPSEKDLPKKFGKRAITSPLPEQWGADILYISHWGVYGAQRKAVPHDLVSSLHDGRLMKSVMLMRAYCQFRDVIWEGKLRYWPDGRIVSGVKDVEYRFYEKQIEKIKIEIHKLREAALIETDDIDETVKYLELIAEFFDSSEHDGMLMRPKGKKARKGEVEEEMDMWVLQGFDGVGVKTARKIRQAFGCIPLRWACDYDDLLAVPGMTQNMAEKLWKRLPLSGSQGRATSKK